MWARRCYNLTSSESSEADATSQREDENVRKHLNLPLATAGDATAECIASNHVGAFSKVFHLRMLPGELTLSLAPEPTLQTCLLCFAGEHHAGFVPALIGAGSTAAILFLLLLVIFYKWRQVGHH